MAYEELIDEAAQLYGVSPADLKAMIQTESNFNANAVSSAGARGLMQLMPRTAADLGVLNAFDPRQNIMGGAKYYKQMLDAFGGDKRLAWAAYNAGPGTVQKYMRGDTTSLPSETINYVSKLSGLADAGPTTMGSVQIPNGKDAINTMFGHQPLTFKDRQGQRQHAFPSNERELSAIEKFRQYDEELRGRLLELGPKLDQAEQTTQSFSQLPDFYDDRLLSLIDRAEV
jgi:hypothetical protein